jgi:hypothetical protein
MEPAPTRAAPNGPEQARARKLSRTHRFEVFSSKVPAPTGEELNGPSRPEPENDPERIVLKCFHLWCRSEAKRSEAKQSKAKQSKAKRFRAFRAKAKQSKANMGIRGAERQICACMQSKAKQSKAKQSKAKQCKTNQILAFGVLNAKCWHVCKAEKRVLGLPIRLCRGRLTEKRILWLDPHPDPLPDQPPDPPPDPLLPGAFDRKTSSGAPRSFGLCAKQRKAKQCRTDRFEVFSSMVPASTRKQQA